MGSEIATLDCPSCFVCGAGGSVLYRSLSDRHFAVPGAWTFLRCPTCEVLWLSPRPADHELGRLYEEYYTHDEPEPEPEPAAVGTGAALRRQLRNALLARTLGYDLPRSRVADALAAIAARVAPLRSFVTMIPLALAAPPGRLLDIGAGDGSFLSTMRSLGWTVCGLEPDPHAAAAGRRRGLDVHVGRLESHDLPPCSFDAVTLSHVVEHVVDPVDALRRAGSLLRPGGRLVVVTPNVRAAGHRRYGSAWMPLDPPRHLHLFDEVALREVARRAGLVVEALSSPSRSALFVTGLSRAIRRTGGAPGQRPSPSARDRLAGVALLLEESVRAGSGEELVLVARPGHAPGA